MPLLFSYGTLRQSEVQQANYGRLLDGRPDALIGYRLTPLAITDPEVVRLSGKAVHNIACRTGDPADRIAGVVFDITEASSPPPTNMRWTPTRGPKCSWKAAFWLLLTWERRWRSE